MIVEVKVPAVGESVVGGEILAWFKTEGESVEVGDNLFELETDKITLTVPSEHAGSLSIKAQVGDEVSVGQVVALINTDGAASSVQTGQITAPAAAQAITPIQTTAPAAAQAITPIQTTQAETPAAAQTTTLTASNTEADNGKSSEPAPVSLVGSSARSNELPDGSVHPSARFLAEQTGTELSQVSGSGKGGRILKEDVIAAIKNPPLAPAPVPVSPVIPRISVEASERQTRKKMSPIRRRIAERLVQAQQTAAILTTFNEVDMSGVMALRKQYQEQFVKKHGIKLGFMSFFVKGVVDALQSCPELNAFIDGQDIVYNNFYDIGIAVGTERGLVVPIVRNADQLGFAEVELEIANLAKKARNKKLTLEDLTGGSFSITNGGIYGSLLSTPILNTPQSGILGMHGIKKRAVVVDDQIVIRPMMYLALSYDHRIVDGAQAVTALKRVCDCIENPERILLAI